MRVAKQSATSPTRWLLKNTETYATTFEPHYAMRLRDASCTRHTADLQALLMPSTHTWLELRSLIHMVLDSSTARSPWRTALGLRSTTSSKATQEESFLPFTRLYCTSARHPCWLMAIQFTCMCNLPLRATLQRLLKRSTICRSTRFYGCARGGNPLQMSALPRAPAITRLKCATLHCGCVSASGVQR